MSMDIKRESLTGNERKTIVDVITGKRNPNSKAVGKILERPRVAIALETILNQMGLSDNVLAERIKAIIDRPETKSTTKTGGVVSNVVGIDANALNAIRTVWQVRGKFIDKNKGGDFGGLKGLTEEQLDGIINSGISITNIQKTTIERSTDASNNPTIRR